MKMLKVVFTSTLFCFFLIYSYSQTPYTTTSYYEIEKLDNSNVIKDNDKLTIFYKLKNNSEKQFHKDSCYALLLLKIAKYELYLNNNADLAFEYTNETIELNKKIHSKTLTFLSNYNLASYYDNQFSYTKAISYCDSTILYCKIYNYSTSIELNAHWIKANIYLDIGDYQKTVDESNFGIVIASYTKDTIGYVYFLNKKAIALFYENYLPESLKNAETAIALNTKMDFFELNMSYKTIARIYENKKQLDSALLFYRKGEKNSLALNNNSLIASNYIDLGNFYLDATHQYDKANDCYYKTIDYAKEIRDGKTSSLIKAMAFTNLCETSLKQQKSEAAEKFIQQAFSNVGIKNKNILDTIYSSQLINITNKELVTYLLFNKTNLLLQKFKNTRQNIYLQACLNTASLADSVITIIRHEQIGEKSKLYWRDKTRDLYPNAIEACYLANNVNLAFYFMEKSRAVLLNDKLNELGALAYLPASESKRQESYQIKIVELEQKLDLLNDTSKQFQATQTQLLNAKSDFEQYIKSLEIKYPEYYQYKYEDKVPNLQQLQQYLSKSNQSFVQYFMDDCLSYALTVTSNSVKLIRFTKNEFDKNELITFLQLCSNKQALNNNYAAFTALSNSIYKKIFQPLSLPKGRIIICTDNTIIPFDALCTDATGKNFLLNDYCFSYVYSARYLLKNFKSATATGKFIGFAPVSFASYLNVNDLKNAAESLDISAANYSNYKLFTHKDASRSNFFKYASSYSVVSIFSHARADTTGDEPVLYMQDSIINLSELQLLNNPATKLILLSACQTNVGKNAAGEGIYSLARGFAAAGIPSVSATLWKADELTIYNISEKFNHYLSEGMNKDEALQKAKIDFIKNNSNGKLLPYYWANMILIGNTDAIQLKTTNTNYLWLILFAIALMAMAIILFVRRKKTAKLKF